MHEDVQFSGNIYAYLKFTIYGRKQTYTRILQCSPTSVGLAWQLLHLWAAFLLAFGPWKYMPCSTNLCCNEAFWDSVWKSRIRFVMETKRLWPVNTWIQTIINFCYMYFHQPDSVLSTCSFVPRTSKPWSLIHTSWWAGFGNTHTVVLWKSAHGRSTLQVSQRGWGWGVGSLSQDYSTCNWSITIHTSVGHSHKNKYRTIRNVFEEQSHSTCILENVEHCGGEPEQAATLATHE